MINFNKNYVLGPKPMENPITKVIKELITRKRKNPADSVSNDLVSVKLVGVVIESLLNAKFEIFS